MIQSFICYTRQIKIFIRCYSPSVIPRELSDSYSGRAQETGSDMSPTGALSIYKSLREPESKRDVIVTIP